MKVLCHRNIWPILFDWERGLYEIQFIQIFSALDFVPISQLLKINTYIMFSPHRYRLFDAPVATSPYELVASFCRISSRKKSVVDPNHFCREIKKLGQLQHNKNYISTVKQQFQVPIIFVLLQRSFTTYQFDKAVHLILMGYNGCKMSAYIQGGYGWPMPVHAMVYIYYEICLEWNCYIGVHIWYKNFSRPHENERRAKIDNI